MPSCGSCGNLRSGLLTISPGLTMIFQFLGKPVIAATLTKPISLFIFASLVNLIAMLLMIIGM